MNYIIENLPIIIPITISTICQIIMFIKGDITSAEKIEKARIKQIEKLQKEYKKKMQKAKESEIKLKELNGNEKNQNS